MKSLALSERSLPRTHLSFQPYTFYGPISNAAGICAATALTAVGASQSIATVAAGTGYMVHARQLLIPTVPIFYDLVAGNRWSVTISGWDQFGDYREEFARKVTDATATRFDLPAFSRIRDVVVTPAVLANPGADTLSVGWTSAVTPGVDRFALPFKPRRVADRCTHVLVKSLGGGGYNSIVANTPAVVSTGTAGFVYPGGVAGPDSNINRAVIALLTDVTAPNTAPLELLCNLASNEISAKY